MSYVPLPTTVAKSKQVLVDFGASQVDEGTFAVVDSDVTASSKLGGQVARVATPDHSLDEVEADAFDVKMTPGAGSAALYLRALIGVVWGRYYVDYTASDG
jgi:hypothetical protein